MGVDGTSDLSAKFAEFAAFGGVGVGIYGISDNSANSFGGVGVGIYGISDNSAKFAEFAAFGGVGV